LRSRANKITPNGWRVSEVPFKGILASALSADPGPDRGRGRQAFNRLLAEVTLRYTPTVVRNTFGSFSAEALIHILFITSCRSPASR